MDTLPDFLARIRSDHLKSEWLISHHLEAAILRLDLMDSGVSGNKWFKLRENLRMARSSGKTALLTFGGPYSNHLVACAAACRYSGIDSIGLVRGAYPADTPSLRQAAALGMVLYRLDKDSYARKTDPDFLLEWQRRYPKAWILPEGGANSYGVEGCRSILDWAAPEQYTHICCSMGTGTTMAGLLNHHSEAIRIGFPALSKGTYLLQEILPYVKRPENLAQLVLMDGYHFGGFARKNPVLIEFMNFFYRNYGIGLDFVYTGKMVYGVFDLIEHGYFPEGSRILMLHTGGMQGNQSLAEGTLCFGPYPEESPGNGSQELPRSTKSSKFAPLLCLPCQNR